MSESVWFQIAPNLTAKQEGSELTLKIDLGKTVGPSSSGKMMGIANTGGFTQLAVDNPRGKDVKLNLYLGEKN
jgi:hypothetical protein